MKSLIRLIIIISVLALGNSYSQYQVDNEIIEPTMPALITPQQPGGRYITSIAENGQYVRVMIVFVQFKDDNYDTSWSEWPKGSPPTNWMNLGIIDQTPSQNTTDQNLTHYYTVMSLGHYKVIGYTYHRVTKNTRDEYISMGWQRGEINRQILQEMDVFTYFAQFDNWNKIGEFNHKWGADSEVDMIWMVYRNIGEDKPNPGYTAWQLGFGDRVWDPQSQTWKYRKWSGEASLGGGGILWVDGGARYIDLGWYGLVSGITIMNGYNGLSAVKNVIIHEFGHHLIGGLEAHFSNSGNWGMMGGYGSRSLMVNSYERHRLGWINFMQYNYNPLLPITLNDFLTSDNALRIEIPGSNPARYYLLENHQRISVFDNIDRTSGGKGIYVIYQSGPDENDLTFYNAEGRNIWSFDHCAMHPTEDVLVPVFSEGIQDPINGKFDTEKISYLHCITGNPASSPIEAYISPLTGQDIFEPLFRGDGRDMLYPGYVEVFNPYSNPFVENLSFQIIEQNNQLKIIQKVESGTIYDTPPSKPQNLSVEPSANNHPYATWDENQEPDVLNGGYYNVWKKTFYNGAWHWDFLAQTENNYYEDVSEDYCPGFPSACVNQENIYYSVTAEDTQGKESVRSDSALAQVQGAPPSKRGTGNYQPNQPLAYSLEQNYPNPFNPITQINFSIKKDGFVTLKIYDILGKEVATLVNENKLAGYYSIQFDASNLPSGIYIYRLTTGKFNASKKLIFLK